MSSLGDGLLEEAGLPEEAGMAVLGEVLRLASVQGRYMFVEAIDRETLYNGLAASHEIITLWFYGPTEALRFCDQVRDHEFTVPGVIVADAVAHLVDEQWEPDHAVKVDVELLLVAE
jgi:hypothetical protein